MKRLHILALLIGLPFALAACGGGGGASGGAAASSATLSGVVADGYLRNAVVYLDLNGNNQLDADEPNTLSGPGGTFQLDPAGHDGTRYPIGVEVVAGQTVDEDSPGQAITQGYTLSAPPNHFAFISPLTSLVWQEMQKNPTLTVQDAEVRVRFKLGAGNELNLFQNYVDNAAAGGDSALAVDSRKCYNAARLVAQLKARMTAELQNNLGTQYDTTDHKVIDFILSDRVLALATSIKANVAAADTPLTQEALSATVDSMLATTDAARLDSDLDAFYQQRIAENLQVWDMTPPQPTQCSPDAAQTAPVTTTVTIDFDEALDPMSVTNDAVTLAGDGSTISGTVSYDATLKRLTFTPATALEAYTSYQVILSSALTDMIGNHISDNTSWSFTTIFNESPPPPPNFS